MFYQAILNVCIFCVFISIQFVQADKIYENEDYNKFHKSEVFRFGNCGEYLKNTPLTESMLPDSEGRKNLKWIHLHGIQFQASDLLRYFSESSKLEVLILNHVTWTGEFDFKLYFPLLRIFHFEFNIRNLVSDYDEDNTDCTYIYRGDLTNLIFFYKVQPNSITSSAYWNNMEHFVLKLQPTGYEFSIDFEKGIVYNYHVRSQPVTALLHNVHNLKLEYLRSIINIDDLPITTTNLKIRYSSIGFDGSMEKLIQKLINLESITFNDATQELSPDISSFVNSNITNIYFQKVHFTKSISSDQQNPIKIFPSVKTLKLEQCTVDLSLFVLPATLLSLKFEGVTMVSGNISKILPNTAITNLTLSYVKNSEILQENETNIINLSDIPSSLKYLSILYMTIKIPKDQTPLTNVLQLKLMSCKIWNNEKFDLNINLFFPNLQHLAVFETGDLDLIYKLLEVPTKLTHLEFEVDTNMDIKPELMNIMNKSDVFNEKFHLYKDVLRFPMQVALDRYSEHEDWIYDLKETEDAKNDASEGSIVKISLISLDALYIIVAVFIVFGILANILSIIVLCKRRMRSTTSYLLIGMSVCDTVLLLTYAVPVTMMLQLVNQDDDNDDEEYQQTQDYYEKLIGNIQNYIAYPLNKTAYTASVYITLLINIERYVAVTFPLTVKSRFTSRRIVIWSFMIVCFGIILNAPRWIEIYPLDTSDPDYEFGKWFLTQSNMYKQLYHGWIWNFIMYVLPMTAMFCLNFGTLRQIKQANSNRKKLFKNAEANDEVRLTIMLMGIVLAFFICNLIYIAMFTAMFYIKDFNDAGNIDGILCAPLVLNSIINFIVYFAISKKFRMELMKMLPVCIIFYKKKQNILTNTSTVLTELK